MQRRTFLSAAAACFASSTAMANWPQWRGPQRDSQISAKPWPGISADVLKSSWRVELAPSYSTPIADDQQVYVTETRDKLDEAVTALDRNTGKKVWEAKWAGAMTVPFFAASNGSWIRSSPLVDEARVYVAGMRDVLAAFDRETGKEAWRLDFVKHYQSSLPSFGFVASPLLDGEHLYVQAGGGLVKVERQTGKTVWRSLADGGGMSGSAFSSPVIATIAGQRQLVVQTRKALVGVDLETGETYWSKDIPAYRGMNILTPLVMGDMIFTSSYGGGTRMLSIQNEGAWRVKEVWNAKTEGYMSSPVLIDGHVYLHLRNRRAVCFEATTGAKRWTTGETFGKYWSMIANGKQILALDERGDLLLINANPEKFDLAEKRKISDAEAWAHLVVSNRQMFVRELNAAAAYQWTS